ncbi:MAG: DUF3086 domain-containing protein [Oculatellaceae cyanobacterium Prado106]|nr:DUF3086 domain-containing protein [Oculatellaceae cyanobacterium Prado106]
MNSDPSFGNSSLDSSNPLSNSTNLGQADSSQLEQRVAELQQQEKTLRQDISVLQMSYNTLQKQISEAQSSMGQVIKEGLAELEQRRQTLQLAVEQLERRQERIRNEMKTTFAGSSQDLAIRVQGFKDYLVGSLQDLVTSAEQLQLQVNAPPAASEANRRTAPRDSRESREVIREGVRENVREGREGRELRSPRDTRDPRDSRDARDSRDSQDDIQPKFAENHMQEQTKRINKLLDQYRMMPDYYGPVWQLRRTFEPIHADRVSNWFFTQGGRGSLKSMGSRLQNVLVASAAISVLRNLYGDRVRVLVLGDSPERLGEWRRGLQDCLGVSRGDFGSDQGIMLFEAPEPLAQRAERLVKQKQLPLIIMDESEGYVSLSLLQFPLWLAFAPDPLNPVVY